MKFRSQFLVCFSLFLITLLSCATNPTTIDNSFKKYFDDNKVDGCFGLWDNLDNHFTIYNLPRFRDTSFLPASTFKVVNALIGIGTGRIFSDTVVLKWDGVTRSNPAWNKDMDMRDAFQLSNVGYFQQVARLIGKDTMQMMLDSLKYGTRKIIGPVDSFWLNNTLKITADEQLGLMKKLYFKQLPFQRREQDIVKSMMLKENNTNYKLSYKTGWGYLPDGKSLGWVVGWIEENVHVYFFTLNCTGAHDADMTTIRMNILKGILTQQGFFQGKK